MPHLITIIKYARKVVKYSLALLSALSAGAYGVTVRAQPAAAPASGPAGAVRVRPALPAGAHCCVRQAIHRG